MTVLQLIKSALRAIGQLGPGRSPGPSETADAVFVFNRMLEAFSVERLAVYRIERTVYTLTSGEGVYTIGDISARPVRVERAAMLADGSERQIDLLSYERWSAGRDGVWYDPSSPEGQLQIRPTPDGTQELVLYTWAQLTQVADETATLEFPPGYAEMLTYQLALRLGAEWGKPARPDVVGLAADALARVKSLNTHPAPEMVCDPALVGRGGFDILRGDYR
jgi:hypothetical protein